MFIFTSLFNICVTVFIFYSTQTLFNLIKCLFSLFFFPFSISSPS